MERFDIEGWSIVFRKKDQGKFVRYYEVSELESQNANYQEQIVALMAARDEAREQVSGLVAAGKDALDCIDYWSEEGWANQVIKKLDAAIAKAEGGNNASK
jgi:hypothetical protein